MNKVLNIFNLNGILYLCIKQVHLLR